MNIEIENYREQPPVGNLIAIFDVYLSDEQVRYRNLRMVKGKKGNFISFPSFVITGDDGEKKTFTPYIEFSKEKQDRFFKEVEKELAVFQKPMGVPF